MKINSIWDPIVKFAAVLAVLLSIVAAIAICASYFGWTEKSFGVTALAMVFAAGLTIFAIVELILSEINLKRERSQAIEFAAKLAQGEMPENEFEGDSELLAALREVLDYRRRKNDSLEKIAAGNLSEDVVLVSEFDAFGQSFQKMVEKLRLSVQTQESRDQLQKSVLKLLGEVQEVAAGNLTGEEIFVSSMNEIGQLGIEFNKMNKSLKELILQVSQATEQVSASSEELTASAQQSAQEVQS